jgi:hypothetical protein
LKNPPVFWPALLTIRAAANLIAGRVPEALMTLQRAPEVDPRDPAAVDIEVLYGDILLAFPDPDIAAAEAHYRRAGEFAHRGGMAMAELRVATRLATLSRGRPDHADAVKRLREVLATFTEGFDTPQLQAARRAAEAPDEVT